jgi:hypothetical protein
LFAVSGSIEVPVVTFSELMWLGGFFCAFIAYHALYNTFKFYMFRSV